MNIVSNFQKKIRLCNSIEDIWNEAVKLFAETWVVIEDPWEIILSIEAEQESTFGPVQPEPNLCS